MATYMRGGRLAQDGIPTYMYDSNSAMLVLHIHIHIFTLQGDFGEA